MVALFVALLAFQSTFEVASVKPTVHRARAVGTVRTFPGGRVSIEGSPLEHLIELALDVQRFQVAGGPDWMYIEGFDIEAKPPATFGTSAIGATLNAGQREMLLALLTERFQLRYRRETRDGPVYFLTRTNKKLKLEQPKNRDVLPWILGPETGISAGNVSMPLLAQRLSRWLDRPVIDRSGIEGAFDFKFEYDSPDPDRDIGASIQVSIQGLGLKLESGKGPVETIVIEHAEKPTAN